VIRDRVIRKTYTMVVHGQIHSSGVIDADLIKDREENQVRIADGTCTEDGRRRAVTIYRPVKTGTRATVVEADLITGRSHQLRVHMASIGHPIVSDPRYGDRRLDQSLLGALQQKQTRKERMRGQRQAEPAQKDRKESGTQKGRRGIRDHSAHRGQLLWCSETAFPKMLPDRAMPRVLAPVAGRVFQCPPPRWWYDLCDI
jgi:23S rRNA pseudouridine955/2504/2580 synthase